MDIGKGMLSLIVGLALFAGPGALHIAQMIGLLKVDIAVSPSDWIESSQSPHKAK